MKKRQNVVTDNGSDRDSNFESKNKERASPVPTPKQAAVGSWVTVRFLNDEPETFKIVQTGDGPNPGAENPTISDTSPLGSCLLGAVVGDIRQYALPEDGGEEIVEVLAIG